MSNIKYILYINEGGLNMSNEKNEITKILVSFPNELIENIETYRFENRIPNRTQAILELIKFGLEKERAE